MASRFNCCLIAFGVALANPWWAFYGKDYAAKTGHLTMLQHGAYFTLLNTYYTTGGPLPSNTESLTRICGAHSAEEIEAVSSVLSSFFSLKSDGWHNKRADAEIREAKRISKLRRLARLGKRKTIDKQVLPVCALQSQSHTHKEKPKSKAYAHSRIAPSLGEVVAYCQERQNAVDPQQWFNYYTANGWKVGRNPMKDWRAAVRTWEKNGFSNGNGKQAMLPTIAGADEGCMRCHGSGYRASYSTPGKKEPCECVQDNFMQARV